MSSRDSPICPAAFDPDDLIRHGRFVRELARELVRDDEAAEELAARSMAIAWEQRPATGPGLRAWFRTVVRRVLTSQRREDERRTRRELDVERATSTAAAPPTVDLVGRIELEQRIATAFAQLDEPYKSTLFLRYFDDLTPSAIAERTKTPLDTVKTRLKRGIERLRVALDAQHGQVREGWRARAVALVLQGAPIVATKSKLVPVAVVAVLALGGSFGLLEAWRRGERGAAAPASTTPAPAQAASVASGDSGAADAARAAAAERSLVGSDSKLPFATGVVVDESDAPISGVRVVPSTLDRPPGATALFQAWLSDAAIEHDTVAVTGADGRFAVAESAHDLCSFWFAKEGYALGEWFELAADRAENQDGRIVLRHAKQLRGFVRDTDGHPIGDAKITINADPMAPGARPDSLRTAENLADRPRYIRSPALTARADATGAFDLRWLADEPLVVGVRARGYDSAAVRSQQAPDPWIATLERRCLLLDVVDADTQALIPQATAILCDRGSAKILQSLVATEIMGLIYFEATPGRLDLRTGFRETLNEVKPAWLWSAPGETRDVRIHVFADGYRADVLDVTLTTKSEPPHLTAELAPDDGVPRAPSIAGRVVGRTDVEIALHWLASNETRVALRDRIPLLTTRPAAGGAFAFADVPDGAYQLVCRGPGIVADVVRCDAPVRDLVVAVASAASIEFTVKDREGRPAPQARLHVQTTDGRTAWSATANAHGVATLDGLPDGPLFAVALLRSSMVFDAPTDVPKPRECFDETNRVVARTGECTRLELPLLEPLPVRFHVERDDGSPVRTMSFYAVDTAGPALAASDGFPSEQKLELDEHGDGNASLLPGRYMLRCYEKTLQRDVALELPRDGAASLNVKLPVAGPTGALRGRIVDLVTGEPVPRRLLRVARADDDGAPVEVGPESSENDGRFAFDAVPAGVIELQIRSHGFGHGHLRSDEPNDPYGPSRQRLRIEPGQTTEVEIALIPANAPDTTFPKLVVSAHVTDVVTGQPIAGATITLSALRGNSELFVGSLQTDDRGHATATVFAADRYRASVAVAAEPGAAPDYEGKLVELVPGAEGAVAIEAALTPRPRR